LFQGIILFITYIYTSGNGTETERNASDLKIVYMLQTGTVGINSCWSEQTFRLFIFMTTVISRRKNQWYSFTVTFGAKYLTGMVTSVPPYETFSLIKNNILHQSKIYKNHFENSNFWGMWPLGHVGHMTYSFKIMLFISTGIFDDKFRWQILSVGTTANAALMKTPYIQSTSQTCLLLF
jgi:hypothetical protein